MRRFAISFVLCFCAACMPESAPFPMEDAGRSEPPRLVATDGTGSTLQPLALSRRPRLRLHGLLYDPATFPVLVRGPLDAALLSDAARVPWSADTVARFVPCDVQTVDGTLVMVPAHALDAGQEFSLLVPAWTRDPTGLPIGRPLAFGLRVREREAGAVLASSFPADGATAVPAALSSFDLRFDDVVEGAETIELVDDEGAIVPTRASVVDCATLGFDDGTCVRLAPSAKLALGRTHTLRVPRSLRDRFGDAPVERIPSFSVQSLEASVAPLPSTLPCGPDERSLDGYCVLVQDVRLVVRARFATPTRVHASLAGEVRVAIDRFGDVRLEWNGLVPSSATELVITSESLDGTRWSRTMPVSTHEPLAWVLITEVRADAVGDEPAQEYVELWNASGAAVDLGGFRLADALDREGDVLPAPLLLDADARLLVVADSFDPYAIDDARPPAGATLARIGSSLGSGGLSNSGEPLFLRDSMGRRIAEVPAIAAPGPGVCVVRLATTDRASPPSAYGVAPHASCTPGTP